MLANIVAIEIGLESRNTLGIDFQTYTSLYDQAIEAIKKGYRATATPTGYKLEHCPVNWVRKGCYTK